MWSLVRVSRSRNDISGPRTRAGIPRGGRGVSPSAGGDLMARVKRAPDRAAPPEDGRTPRWVEALIADPRGMPPTQYDLQPTSTKYRGQR